jgi:Domain of unknown function (DUF4129)
MDLERIAVVLRPRRHWEAVDLGFALARAWWRPVYAAWLATVLPVWVVISALLYRYPGWALLALWWLRPLFDRVPLFVLSRALFGAAPTLRETWRELPRLWLRHLPAALVLRRIDLARSFHLPVWQLEEGLQGSQRRQRIRLLSLDGESQAAWTTLACISLELAAYAALLGLLSLLEPHPGAFGLGSLLGLDEANPAPAWAWLLWSMLSFLALTAIEPFYVAAGFSLYLSRRTRLEGWDVEIALRRLAARLTVPRVSAAALLLLGLLGAALSAGGASAAAPRRPASGAPANPEAAIQEVLRDPAFTTEEKRQVWRLKDPLEEKPPPERRDLALPELLAKVVRPLAFTLAAVLVAALVLLVVRHVRGLPGGGPRRAVIAEAPALLFGMDLRPESLPDDVPGAAWALWERGERAAALGLLYRGALVGLVQHDGLPVQLSWTEGDCLRSVLDGVRTGRTGRERAESFARLTRAWQAAAYAHRPPAGEEMQELCGVYRRHFGAQRMGEAA